MLSYRWTAAIVAFVAIGCMLVGCGGKGSSASSSEVAGKWVEQRGTVPPNLKDKDFTREMTLNSDGTFNIVVIGKDGQPVAGRTADGTWKSSSEGLRFTVKNDALGGTDIIDSPIATILIQLKSRGQSQDLIRTRDARGGKTEYVRK